MNFYQSIVFFADLCNNREAIKKKEDVSLKKIVAIIVAAVVVIGAGVGVYLYISKSKNAETTPQLEASFEDFTLNETIYSIIQEHPDRYKTAFLTDYSMDDKTAQSLIDTPENWLAFNLFVTVNNPNDKDMCINDIKVDGNGDDGLYIHEALGSSMDVVSANGSYSLCIPVFIHTNEPSLDEVKAMVLKKNVFVVYSDVPTEIGGESTSDKLYEAKVQMK